eukprot:2044721-Pleurochrysis_carterae.AAC.1
MQADRCARPPLAHAARGHRRAARTTEPDQIAAVHVYTARVRVRHIAYRATGRVRPVRLPHPRLGLVRIVRVCATGLQRLARTRAVHSGRFRGASTRQPHAGVRPRARYRDRAERV